jgi:hypothetical protein
MAGKKEKTEESERERQRIKARNHYWRHRDEILKRQKELAEKNKEDFTAKRSIINKRHYDRYREYREVVKGLYKLYDIYSE